MVVDRYPRPSAEGDTISGKQAVRRQEPVRRPPIVLTFFVGSARAVEDAALSLDTFEHRCAVHCKHLLARKGVAVFSHWQFEPLVEIAQVRTVDFALKPLR